MAVNLFIAIVLQPYIIRKLGDVGYGIWVLVLGLIDYYWLLDLGFRSATIKYSAEYRATGETGKIVHKVLVAQDVYYPGPNPVKEFYLSILLDRAKGQNVFMYSTEGGMDIEEVAHKTPDKIFKEWVFPGAALQGFQARKIAFNLGLEFGQIIIVGVFLALSFIAINLAGTARRDWKMVLSSAIAGIALILMKDRLF